jgi:hypothetical protein
MLLLGTPLWMVIMPVVFTVIVAKKMDDWIHDGEPVEKEIW